MERPLVDHQEKRDERLHIEKLQCMNESNKKEQYRGEKIAAACKDNRRDGRLQREKSGELR